MRSIRLVILSLVVGFTLGAAVMHWHEDANRMPVPASASPAPAHPTGPAPGRNPASPDKSAKSRAAPDDGYHRIASALINIDERLSLMEAREESNLERQKKMVEEIRELAIALEVKSGALKPLRERPPAPLEPVRGQPAPPAQDVRLLPVPAVRPAEPALPTLDDEMPEW